MVVAELPVDGSMFLRARALVFLGQDVVEVAVGWVVAVKADSAEGDFFNLGQPFQRDRVDGGSGAIASFVNRPTRSPWRVPRGGAMNLADNTKRFLRNENHLRSEQQVSSL